jgi:hypothetical protein
MRRTPGENSVFSISNSASAGRHGVETLSLQEHVQPWEVFCPIHFSVWQQMLDPAVSWNFDEHAHAIQLWNELWYQSGVDKSVQFPTGCLYERLKERYLE